MARGNVESWVVFPVGFGMRGIVVCKSWAVKIVQYAGGVFNTGGKENGGVGDKKGYIYSSSCNFLVQYVTYDNFD